MSTTISEMSKQDLQELIEETVEKKLVELLGDPDEGFELQDEMRERLLQQREELQQGKRGTELNEVMIDLGLE